MTKSDLIPLLVTSSLLDVINECEFFDIQYMHQNDFDDDELLEIAEHILHSPEEFTIEDKVYLASVWFDYAKDEI